MDETLPGFLHRGEHKHAAVQCFRKYDFSTGRNKNARQEPTRIVVHWGGIDVDHCYRVLKNNRYFTHFGVGRDGVYQWMDTSYRGTHAGSAGNGQSIGIDICQQPLTKYEARYAKAGYDCDIRRNEAMRPDGRWVGHPDHARILTLDSAIAQHTNDLLHALCEAYDIPKVWPGDHRLFSKAKAKAFRGVLFHSHLSATKWDVACWAHQIMDGFETAE